MDIINDIELKKGILYMIEHKYIDKCLSNKFNINNIFDCNCDFNVQNVIQFIQKNNKNISEQTNTTPLEYFYILILEYLVQLNDMKKFIIMCKYIREKCIFILLVLTNYYTDMYPTIYLKKMLYYFNKPTT